MKAIILASGIGSRLGPLTQNLHKALIKITDQTLLERALDSLIANGITDIIITTGYKEEEIKKHIAQKSKYNSVHIRYVLNPKYAETNYIYSLWLAREYLMDDDIIMLHGDVVFDASLLTKIVKQEKSAVTVSKRTDMAQKDLKARVEDGYVVEIDGGDMGGEAYLCTSILKVFKKDMKIWMREIDNFVDAGIVNCYAEAAFNTVSDKMRLTPLVFDEELGMDIDNEEDLEKVRAILQKK